MFELIKCLFKCKKSQLWGLMAKELFIGLMIGLIIGFVVAVLIAKGMILQQMNFICPPK